jgi:hypothetical protein
MERENKAFPKAFGRSNASNRADLTERPALLDSFHRPYPSPDKATSSCAGPLRSKRADSNKFDVSGARHLKRRPITNGTPFGIPHKAASKKEGIAGRGVLAFLQDASLTALKSSRSGGF